MNDKEWRQLVSSALQNDKTAFERLYMETERSVYFLCLKLLGNEQNAKDIVQETYLAAYNGLSGLADGANFPKWINGIAVNQCRRFFRNPASESLDEKLEQGKEFADEENFIPEEYVTDAEKRKVIMNIIDTELSEVQRQTVILYYYNGLKTHEIAGIMNCPEGTVTYRLSAAREKIREAVLIYEEKHKERLHAIMPIPVLTRILRSEAEQIAVPDIRLFENSAASANNIKAGGSASMKSALTGKIIAAAAAVVVVGGGIAAGVAMSNRDSEEIELDRIESTVTESKTETENKSVLEETDESSAAEIEYEESIAEAETETPLKDPTYIGNFSNSPYKFYVPSDFEQVLSYIDGWYGYNDEDIDDDIFYSLGSIYELTDKKFEEFFAENEEFAEYGFDINNIYDLPKILFSQAPFYFGADTMLDHADKNKKLWKEYTEYKEANGKEPYINKYYSTYDVETDEETTLLGFPALHRTGIIKLGNPNEEGLINLYFEAYYLVAPFNGRKSILECVIYSETKTDETKAKIAEYMKEVVANSYISEDQ